MSNYEKEYEYMFNKYFSNSQIVGETKAKGNSDVKETEAIINGENYISYNHSYGNFVFIPKGMSFDGDFSPVYILGKSPIGFHFDTISKKDGLLEYKLYCLSCQQDNHNDNLEVMYDYSAYQDDSNRLLEVFNQENLDIDSFMLAGRYYEVTKNNYEFCRASLRKYDGKTEQLFFEGSRIDIFKKFMDGALSYELVDIGDKTMFETIDELIKKEEPKIMKKNQK